MSTDKLKISW